jgi:hypothetical protein
VLRQQILAAALIIAMAAIPEQPWTIQWLRIRPWSKRLDRILVYPTGTLGLERHALAEMILIKLSQESACSVLHDLLMGMAWWCPRTIAHTHQQQALLDSVVI